MSDKYTTVPSFNFGDSTDDDSGISTVSGRSSIKLDSEAQSVRSWDSESQRSWENDEDDDDDEADDALGIKSIALFDFIFDYIQLFNHLKSYLTAKIRQKINFRGA